MYVCGRGGMVTVNVLSNLPYRQSLFGVQIEQEQIFVAAMLMFQTDEWRGDAKNIGVYLAGMNTDTIVLNQVDRNKVCRKKANTMITRQ
jgi:hypothetical protein